MRYTQVLLLLALVGWLGSSASRVWAQDASEPPLAPPFEDTASPGDLPTPRLARVAVGIGPGGVAFRILYDPAWIAALRPRVRVGQVRTEPQSAIDTAPRLEGGADELQYTLTQALDRAQPSATPAP